MGSRSEDVGDSPVRISIHSNGDSVRENVSPLSNIGASGVSHTAEQTLRSGRPSIFALRSSYNVLIYNVISEKNFIKIEEVLLAILVLYKLA